jgi:alpha-ribazole phosphatase
VNEAPPGGEPLADLHRRIRDFLDSMCGYNGDGVIAITHGGPIRCLIADALGMPLANLIRLRIDYGSLSTLTLDTSGVVVEFVNFKLVTETTKATPGSGA